MIKLNEALQKTMQDCGVTGVYLSAKTGVSAAAISRFLQGHCEMKSGTLEKLLDALPPDAQLYYFNAVYARTNDLRAFLDEATQEEKAEILHMVAESLEKSSSPLNQSKTVETKAREVVPI